MPHLVRKLSLPALALLVASTAAAAEPAGLPADADPGQVVGRIQGKAITLGDLKNSGAERLGQMHSGYELRRAQLDIDYQRAQQQALEEELNHSLNRQAMALEAAARKSSVLKLSGEVPIPPVTDQEVRSRYDSRKVEGAPPLEQVAADIRKGLEEEHTSRAMEAYYATLRVKYSASALLAPMRQKVGAEGPARGPRGAAITIVEFADFQCPFCRRMAPTLKQVLARYPQQVRLVFRHFPLTDIHPEALHAAQAAVCAGRQGKFWEMHDGIFGDSAPLSVESLRAIAARVGLAPDPFERCVRDGDVTRAIMADSHAAEELDVRATPTLFVNGRYLQGGVPEETVVALIEDELKRLPSATAARTAAR